MIEKSKLDTSAQTRKASKSISGAPSANYLAGEEKRRRQSAIGRCWTKPTEWPRAAGYVFLAEAVRQVGKALVPEWTDSDPIAADAAAVSRFSIVQTKIAEAAATGKLVTGVRAIGGGDVERLPPGAWQTEGESLAARFALGRMISTMPFSTDIFDGAPFMRPYHGYVFVESNSLADLLQTIGGAQADSRAPSAVGRKPIDDAKGLAKMRQLLSKGGGARSVNDAATQVAQQNSGHSENATVKRLRDKYRKAAKS
jgi:hypothetical protein